MFKTKGLEEKKNDLITRAEALVNGAEAEKRELTPDEMAELAEIRDDVKKIKDALKISEDLADEKTEIKDEAEAEAGRACGEDKKREDAEERAFDAYIRNVALNTRAGDVVLTKGDNGAIIPQTIANKIISKVYQICPILEKSTKYNVKGKLIIPSYAEDSNGQITVAYADEFEELESNVGKFTNIELTGFLAGALTKISKSLINNSQFNLVDFVVNKMAEAIKRFIENELLNGTEDKVEGLSGATNVVTAGSATAITADDLIDVQDAVKDNFQNGAMWIMSTNTRKAIRKLKDKEGNYLLNKDITSPFGYTLLGKPVYTSDNMVDMSAGKTPIYYGDFSGLATKFSEEMSIEVLREKFATQHAVGVVGWLEFDSKVEDNQKISKLTMATA